MQLEFYSDADCTQLIETSDFTGVAYTNKNPSANWCTNPMRAFTGGNQLAGRTCSDVPSGDARTYELGFTFNSPVDVKCVKRMGGFDCEDGQNGVGSPTPVRNWALLKTNGDPTQGLEEVEQFCANGADDAHCYAFPTGSGTAPPPGRMNCDSHGK